MRKFLVLALMLVLPSVAFAEDAIQFKITPAVEAAKPGCICWPECKCAPGDCPGQCPVSNSKSDPKRSSVYVSFDLGGGRMAGGTGTVIASEGDLSLVLTNAHVVPDGMHAISVTHWGEGYPMKSPATYLGGSSVSELGAHEIRVNGPDLALIAVSRSLPAVPIADAIPAPGTAVSFYGFGGAGPYGTTPIHKTGKVRGDAGWSEPATLTSIASVNGDSGAGVLNEAGQLVAVHWGGGCVRLDAVHSFTISVLERKGLFGRFKDRLAARQLGRALAAVPGNPFSITPAKPILAAPFAGGCAGGQCPNTSRRRR